MPGWCQRVGPRGGPGRAVPRPRPRRRNGGDPGALLICYIHK